jgi:hypothetical protein
MNEPCEVPSCLSQRTALEGEINTLRAALAVAVGYVTHKADCESLNRRRVCPSCRSHEVVWPDRPVHGCDKCGVLFTVKVLDCTCGAAAVLSQKGPQ